MPFPRLIVLWKSIIAIPTGKQSLKVRQKMMNLPAHDAVKGKRLRRIFRKLPFAQPFGLSMFICGKEAY